MITVAIAQDIVSLACPRPGGRVLTEAAPEALTSDPACVFLLAAPLASILSNRFGHRLAVMLGGVLVSTGMVIASFSQKVYHMYIAIGVVSGKCAFSSKVLWGWGGREGYLAHQVR